MGLEIINNSIKQYGTTVTRYSLADLFNPSLTQFSCSLNTGQVASGYVQGSSITLESSGEKNFTSDGITFLLKYSYFQTGGGSYNPYVVNINTCSISGTHGIIYEKPYECIIANVKKDGVDYSVKAKIIFESGSQFIRLTLVYASTINNGSPREVTDGWTVMAVVANNDTIINNVLTVNERAEFKDDVVFQDSATFQENVSVNGVLHLGSDLIGMGYKVYDMNYESTVSKNFHDGINIFTITNSENLMGVAVCNFTFKGHVTFVLDDDLDFEFSIPQNVFLAEGAESRGITKINVGSHTATLSFRENTLKLEFTYDQPIHTFSITGKIAGIYLPEFN